MLAANFSDPENARIIYLAAGGLIVMAVALVVGTVWWWRSSAVEHPVLGPLEVMGTKPFLTADDELRRDLIESARPGAVADEADDDLVLAESFDEVFPDGVGPAAAPLDESVADAPGRRTARVTSSFTPATAVQPASVGGDPFQPFQPFDNAYDDSNEIAVAPERVASADLDAMADDIWGPAPRNDRPAPRPIDPLLKSDDIW